MIRKEYDSPFVWDEAEIRRVGARVIDLIAKHLGDLPARPVFQPVPPTLARELMAESPPQSGESADVILDAFATSIAPYPFGNGHPRFYGWVNSPPAVIGILADALAAAMNPSVAGGNHAAVWTERQVIQWITQLLGFPPESMGVFVSGGSAAAITALAVARFATCAKHGWDVRSRGLFDLDVSGRRARLLVYKSAEGHACNQKAVELLGLGSDQIRIVPTDASLRMIPRALDQMLREDEAKGDVPMAVVASAGTVNTGAIDPLGALADVCAQRRVWLHVDGAYGAPAILTAEYRAALGAIARADSVALDPHKWLYVPVDAGLVLVRDADAMRNSLSLVPPYLRTDGNMEGVQGPTWFSEYSIEQTRPFRALKTWASLRYFGLDGYRRMIEHDISLARRLADKARATPHFEVLEPQNLSIVCLRAVPSELLGDEPALNSLNARALQSLQLSGEGFLSGTTLGGTFWLRACVVNPRATEADIDAVFDAVRAAVARSMQHSPATRG